MWIFRTSITFFYIIVIKLKIPTKYSKWKVSNKNHFLFLTSNAVKQSQCYPGICVRCANFSRSQGISAVCYLLVPLKTNFRLFHRKY